MDVEVAPISSPCTDAEETESTAEIWDRVKDPIDNSQNEETEILSRKPKLPG